MSTYNAAATLTMASGVQVTGTAALQSSRDSHGRASWEGRFRPASTPTELRNSGGSTLRLTLTDGRAGDVLIQDVAGVSAVLTVLGVDEPPF